MAVVGATLVALASFFFFDASSATTTSSVSISSALKAAKWNSTVKLTYSKTSIILQPTGIPDHTRDAYYAVPNAGVVVPDATSATIVKDPTKAQTYKFTIPTVPKYSSKTTSAPLGSIGVMISGAVLYNPYERWQDSCHGK